MKRKKLYKTVEFDKSNKEANKQNIGGMRYS